MTSEFNDIRNSKKNCTFTFPMKKLFSSLLLLIYLVNTSSAQFTKAELRADGLTCSLCSNSTYKQLKTLDFIDSISMNLDRATFILYFKEGKDVDFEKIRNRVEYAGFTVGMLKATYNFKNFPVDTIHCFNLQNNVFCFVNLSPHILNGEADVQIIDPGFINNKDYKKYAGILAAHPDGTYMRVFHVIYVPE
jgi:copper chaperone CopZ